jgi:hypothetical protein
MNWLEAGVITGITIFVAMAPVTMLQYVCTWLLIGLAQAGIIYYSV